MTSPVADHAELPPPTLEEIGVTTEEIGGFLGERAAGPEAHGRTVEER